MAHRKLCRVSADRVYCPCTIILKKKATENQITAILRDLEVLVLTHLKLFGIALVATLIIDYVWLGLVAKNYYLRSYGELARVENGQLQPVLWAAILVYIFLGLGIVGFALPKINSEDTWLHTFLVGALLGLVIYGVYDMTAMAVIRNWPLVNSFVDMAWGSVLCGLVTVIARWSRDSWFA